MRNVLSVLSIIIFIQCSPNRKELTGHLARPSISPDGKQLAFIHAKDAENDVWEVYTSDSSGNNVKRLTDFKEARIKKGPVWSPNGKKIAFHADIDNGAQIFSMDSNGENLIQLTHLSGYAVEPYWSSLGDEIIFNFIPKDGKTKMLIMNSNGLNIRELPNPDGHNWYPRLTSTDKIIFTSDVNHVDFYDIFIMDMDSSNLGQLTTAKAINWFPELSPDGNKIVFHSNRDDPELSDSGDYNLFMMNTDGTDVHKLTSLPGQQLHAKWHPSGKELIFEWHNEGHHMGIHKLHLESGEIQKIKLLQPKAQ